MYQLSPELVFSICDKLPITDLKQLRLSCKAIGRIADCLVLRKLRISAKGSSLDESISYLQSFAQSPARYIAQEILIDDLSPLSLSSSRTNDSDNVEPSVVPRSKEKIRELIMEALASLTAVRRVSWCPNQKDCLWIQETVWSVIQSFSALRYLYIEPWFLQFSLTFKAFTTLESISMDASACSELSWLYTSLSKLYASCPTLTSLAISDRSGHNRLNINNNVDQIFLGGPNNIQPSRLRRLCLHNCFVRIDKITLPHLRQLTSLELICMQHRYSGQDLDYYGYPRDIWSTFIGSGIQLEELVHNTTSTSLIDYLSSYSGLRKLELSVSPFADASSSDEAATRFFNDVLSRHFETLESLSLEAYYEGEWCFTSRNAGLISQCTKLNHLLMSVVPLRQEEEDDQFDTNVVANPNPNMVKHVLDTVIQLPLMTHISLMTACPESHRHNWCGTGRRSHRHWSKDEIEENVKKYRPLPSCQYLTEVRVGDTTFEGIRAANGRLRYVAV